LQLCPCQTAEERYNSSEPRPKKEIPNYNPQTGRFLSRDPEMANRYDPKSLHKYLYASGDPLNRIDPRGRENMLEVGVLYLKSNISAVVIGNAFGCGASMGFAYAAGILFQQAPNAGDYFFMSEGCFTMAFNPAKSAIPQAATVGAVLDWVGVAGCAWGFIEQLQAVNASLRDPDNAELDQKVELASASALTGCVVPIIAALL
jgi:hypothetical protein